jgi:hypothetical protein
LTASPGSRSSETCEINNAAITNSAIAMNRSTLWQGRPRRYVVRRHLTRGTVAGQFPEDAKRLWRTGKTTEQSGHGPAKQAENH